MTSGIVQSALPPYHARCLACGHEWEGKPARGSDRPTEASLDREATRHWAECPGRSTVVGRTPQ